MKMEEIEKLLLEGNLKFQWKLQQGLETYLTREKTSKYPILIITCMDSRIDVHKIFQLEPGDVFVLRNAGNIYTKDMLRSILIAVSKFNVKIIVVLGHLDCGMTKINLKDLKKKLGLNLTLPEIRTFFQPFMDELLNISNQVRTLREYRDLSSDIEITGMLYDVNTGYVFEREIIEKFRFIEGFHKNYLDLVERKRSMSDGDFLKTRKNSQLKEEQKNKMIEQAENELSNDAPENISIEESINELKEYYSADDHPLVSKIDISLMKLPKIYIPKIKIHIPQVYKKKNQK